MRHSAYTWRQAPESFYYFLIDYKAYFGPEAMSAYFVDYGSGVVRRATDAKSDRSVTPT
jgi:hypothetical protein